MNRNCFEIKKQNKKKQNWLCALSTRKVITLCYTFLNLPEKYYAKLWRQFNTIHPRLSMPWLWKSFVFVFLCRYHVQACNLLEWHACFDFGKFKYCLCSRKLIYYILVWELMHAKCMHAKCMHARWFFWFFGIHTNFYDLNWQILSLNFKETFGLSVRLDVLTKL